MTAAYPQSLDKFREYLDGGTDHLYAQDLNDYYAVASAIQAEMGVKPSGSVGTVWSRLFQNGNITAGSTRSGWRPLKWDGIKAATGNQFNRASAGRGVNESFSPNNFRGQSTVFGEDTPACFSQLQWPIDAASGAGGSFGRGGVPWHHALAFMNDDLVSWIAVDGDGQELISSNSVSCSWGFMVWNLLCGSNAGGG